jgi:hypothetical protein
LYVRAIFVFLSLLRALVFSVAVQGRDAGQKMQASLLECVLRAERAQNIVGQTLDQRVKLSRADALLALFESNVSLSAAGPILSRFEQGFGVKLGGPTNLYKYITGIFLYQLDLLHELFENSFSQWSSVVDGSPFYANAEAIMIRVVTKEWKIVVVVVRVAMLKKSANHEVLVQSYLRALERMKLKLSNQRAIMADRAATNGKFIRVLKDHHGAPCVNAKCCSHTITRVGVKFEAESCKKICAQITQMFCHPGYARQHHTNEFGVAPMIGGGNRWWVAWEQYKQISEVVGGLEVFLERIAKPCVQKKYSLEASTKAVKLLENPFVLAKATVELAAQVAGGAIFVSTTYTLESGHFAIMCAHDQLKK